MYGVLPSRLGIRVVLDQLLNLNEGTSRMLRAGIDKSI